MHKRSRKPFIFKGFRDLFFWENVRKACEAPQKLDKEILLCYNLVVTNP